MLFSLSVCCASLNKEPPPLPSSINKSSFNPVFTLFCCQDVVQQYIKNLLTKAVDYLVKLWGTEKFPIPGDMAMPVLRCLQPLAHALPHPE